MIILDTNVVSEPMRPNPDAQVMAWLAAQDAAALFLTAITEAELRTGAALMPEGKRREATQAALEAVIVEDFADRVLPFEGGAAAQAYAAIQAERRALGRPISMGDAMIAAIARSRGAQVATRNVADFEATGVKIIDPWEEGGTNSP